MMKIIIKNKRRRTERKKEEDGEFSACALRSSRRDGVEKLWRQNGPSAVIVHCAFVSAVGYTAVQCTHLASRSCGVHI